jgi:hypothetical protein
MMRIYLSLFFLLFGFSLAQETANTPSDDSLYGEEELIPISEEKAIPAVFLLKSGHKKGADFLGLYRDTLYLGGKIKGRYRVVPIAKEKFKAVLFKNGKKLDLSLSHFLPDDLTPEAQTASDSSSENSASNLPDDSSTTAEEKTKQIDTSSVRDSAITASTSVDTSGNAPKVEYRTIRDTIRVSECPRDTQSSYLYISTEPEGAYIYIDGERQAEATPFRMRTDKKGRLLLRARWQVEGLLWAGEKHIRVHGGDSLSVFIPMQRVRPSLLVHSQPTGAEVYAQPLPDSYSRPRHRTPYTFRDILQQEQVISLRQEGFHDTTLIIPMDLRNSEININMRPIQDSISLSKQEEFLYLRQRHESGRIFLYSSIGPAIMSGIFSWISKEKAEQAQQIKEELEQPALADGTKRNEAIEANKEAYESSLFWQKASWISLATGLGMAGAGFILYF